MVAFLCYGENGAEEEMKRATRALTLVRARPNATPANDNGAAGSDDGQPSDEHVDVVVVGPPARHPQILHEWTRVLVSKHALLSSAPRVAICGRAPLGVCVLLGIHLRAETVLFQPPLRLEMKLPHHTAASATEAMIDIEMRDERPRLAVSGRRVGNVLVYLTLDHPAKRVSFNMLRDYDFGIAYIVHVHPFGDATVRVDTTNQDNVASATWYALNLARVWVEEHMSHQSAIYLSTSAPMPLSVMMGTAFRPALTLRDTHILDRGVWNHTDEAGVPANVVPTYGVTASFLQEGEPAAAGAGASASVPYLAPEPTMDAPLSTDAPASVASEP